MLLDPTKVAGVGVGEEGGWQDIVNSKSGTYVMTTYSPYDTTPYSMHDQSNSNMIERFSSAYRPIHGWLSTFVCLFGIPSNLLNIIVLTRPNMITSPTNLILTALAFSDLFTMLSSIVFGIYYYIVHINDDPFLGSVKRDTWGWVHFSMLHVMASVTFHSISIWLTVYLACFRYIYLASSSSAVCGAIHPTSAASYNRHPRSSSSASSTLVGGRSSTFSTRERLHSVRHRAAYMFQRCLLQCRTYNCTLVGILNICIFCVIFCVPAYMYPKVKRCELFNVTEGQLDSCLGAEKLFNGTSIKGMVPDQVYYQVTQSELDQRTNNTVFKITFYTQAILGKFIPCILLVTFSGLLIHSLVVINRNNKRLNRSSATPRRRPSKPTLLQRFLGVIRFKKPTSLAESNRHNSNNRGRQTNRPASNNNNVNNCSSGSEQAKKSVSLQVPERLLVGIEHSSTSSHATAFTSPGPCGSGGAATSPSPLTPSGGPAGGEITPGSTFAPTVATASTSASALSLAARRLSEIRLHKKFFPSNSSSPHRPAAIELEDDDVPVRIPPKLSAHNSFHNDKIPERRKLQPVPNTTVVKPKRNKTKENLRTTLMLIIVCILFLITEFPQAILIFFSIIQGDSHNPQSFYRRVYTPLGDLLDMLALINNSINFLLYCTMSRAFRNTFYTLIMRFSCCAWLLSPCLSKDAREVQAHARSKRQARKSSASKAGKDANNNIDNNNLNNNNNNNLNVLINSNNFSIFTGNTGVQNGAKEIEIAALPTTTTPTNGTTPIKLENGDNIELKPLIRDVDNKA